MLRKVVATRRARIVGSPLSEWVRSVGRALSQSEMYSRSPMGKPATEVGVRAEGGMVSGKTVDMTPDGERARRRRAINVDVNHDGRDRVSTGSDSVEEVIASCGSTACGLSRGMAEAVRAWNRARSPRTGRATMVSWFQ